MYWFRYIVQDRVVVFFISYMTELLVAKLFVCVRAFMRARVYVHKCICVCVCARVCVCTCMHA